MSLNEEEAMELSGESNIVSNLHNFSFDVSWADHSSDPSPPLQRRTTSFLSPQRFTAISTPKPRSWKSLTLKERPLTPHPSATVKLSHKTIATYHDGHPVCDRRQSFSPMELDLSDTSFDFNNSGSKTRRSRSDFGVSYSNSRAKDVPLLKMEKITEMSPIRKRNINNNMTCDSSLDDSVFFRDSSKGDKWGREYRSCNDDTGDYDVSRLERRCSMRGTRSRPPDSMTKSSFLLLVVVVMVSSCIGGYLFFQMGWCAIFDVDTVKLRHKLEDNVFGQHIAVKAVIESLDKFAKDIREKNGKRSLVLSFHGWTGIGKNYISKFITEAFYNSKISLYLGPLHLVNRFGNENQNGKDRIKSWILGNVTTCGVNVIIIDEVDKADVDHLTGIEAVIETLDKKSMTKKDGIVKRGPVTVFIFLSNSRASQINHYLFSQMLIERERDLIRKTEFDEIFEKSKSEWYERMKSRGMIDHFVPFLPLTETHVKQCIERDFIRKGRDPNEDLVMAVMEELSFVDMGGKNGQVSLTGCKRVQDKVNLHLDD